MPCITIERDAATFGSPNGQDIFHSMLGIVMHKCQPLGRGKGRGIGGKERGGEDEEGTRGKEGGNAVASRCSHCANPKTAHSAISCLPRELRKLNWWGTGRCALAGLRPTTPCGTRLKRVNCDYRMSPHRGWHHSVTWDAARRTWNSTRAILPSANSCDEPTLRRAHLGREAAGGRRLP